MFNQKSILFSLSVAFVCIPVISAEAQLLPDNTLGGESSLVNSINLIEDRIDGGAIRGANLFHSFKEFNIGNNRSVYFNNPTAIQNILTRVTGNNSSQILGKLGVLGDANLFLINPKGIIFGKDASLDINGSFVGSTANFIDFADGIQFSAVLPDKPLLTISVPLGLGLENPGEILVKGDGSNLSVSRFGVPLQDNGTKVLEVNPGKTIALIGGNIILEGGSLKSDSGRIELGSVGSGNVDFSVTPQNIEFSYDKVNSFKDIQFLKESSLMINSLSPDLDIENAGSIQLQGRQISIKDGSVILSINQGNLISGGININAAELLEIIGHNPKETNFSSLRSQALLEARGADINIDTKRLFIKDGGIISAYNFGSNLLGQNIQIKASDAVEVIGKSAFRHNPSVIATNAFHSGNGGNINISTNRLSSLAGSTIASSVLASGNAGNLRIDARDYIEVIGINQFTSDPSALGSATFGSGNGGNLTLNTKRLTVSDGGRVDASTIGKGTAGSITINAFNSVELTGYDSVFLVPSLITSSADIADLLVQRVLGLKPIPLSGDSGAITINTHIPHPNCHKFISTKQVM